MRDLLAILAEWSARGQPSALATVVAVHGRAPLPLGSTLIVAGDGGTAGAVSGGCVEQEVIRAAQYVLRGAPAERLRFAPGTDGLTGSGLPCGGGIDVWVQPWLAGPAGEARGKVDAAAAAERLRVAAEQARFAEAARDGAPAVLAFALDDGTGFELVVDPPAQLALVGAGLVAGALCTIARSLDMTPVVIDPRPAVAAQAPLEAADQLLLDWPEEAFAKLPPLGAADAVVVLSHQPALDDAALLAALNSEAGFIGALGSAHGPPRPPGAASRGRTAPADIARIIGPVGLDLGGWTPAEVAVSIAGELIAARHGRAGGASRHARRDSWRALGARYGAPAVTPLIDAAGTANGDAASIGVVILAAGGGKRFGSLKQVACVHGQPLVAHAVRAAEGVPPPAPIVVVVGCGADDVRAALPGRRERAVFCPDWQQGVASSLRCGLHALGHQDAVLVLLADQPLVDASLVRSVLKAGLPRVLAGSWPAVAPSGAQVDAPDAARPVSGGVPGHPVLLGPGALARLHALEPDRGMAAVLAPGRVFEIPVDGPAATLDVDVPADLLRAEQAA